MKKVILVIGFLLICVLGNAQGSTKPLPDTTPAGKPMLRDSITGRYTEASIKYLAELLSPYFSGGGTDDQQLTKLGNIVSLENGGSIDLSEYQDQIITDYSFNESTNILSLTLDGNPPISIDLSSLAGGGSGGSDTALQIVAKLESLTGDDRLDYSAIKNTPTFTDTNTTVTDISNSRSGNNITISITDSDANIVSTTFTDLQGSGSGSSGNGNIIVANTLADIQNAPEGSYIDIQSNFPLVADYIAIPNQIWSFSTGSIDTNGFTLTGTNTKPIFNGDLPGIVGEGTIDGTWNAPAVIFATNFGLKGDGKEYETGSITSGSNILTVTGANFTADDIGHFIAVKGAVAGFVDSSIGQKSLQTTIIGVNSPTEVVVADNATRTTTETTVWTGFDNFQNGKNAIYVRNQKSGKFIFTPGLYFKSEYTFNGALGIDDPVVGWYFGDGTDDIVVEAYGATIASIPHNLRRTRMITYGNTHRFRWNGGILRQDRLMHNYTGQPLADSGDDFNICMYGRTAAYHTHIKDVVMMQTEGTLFSTAGDLQFTNYIKGDNVTNVQQRVTQMVYGDVDDVTGEVSPDPNSDFAYTELYLDVTTQQFENTRLSKPDRKGLRNYQFAGQASTGWSGLTDKWFKAYYYDINGNFLYASGEQRFYQTYEYNDEVAFVRIKVNRPEDLSLIDVQVRAPMNGHHLILTNVHLREAAAHALSNMPSHFIMIGGSMKKIGLVLPAFASNTEDQHSTTQDQQFIGVIFENTFTGDLNWINTVGVKVINCTFYGTSDPNYLRTNYTRALSMDDSRDAMAHGNHIFNGSIQVDRNAQLYDNTVINGEIQIRANGADVYDNEFHNVVVANLDAPIADRALSYFKDNRMTHDRPWASYLFTDTNMNVGYEDINIILNDKTRLSNTFEQDTPYERIVLGDNGGSRMWNAAPTPSKDYGGYLKNFSIKGARQPRDSRDFASTSVYWPITNYDNVYSEASINLKYGLPKDRIFNDLKIDGWLRIDADQFGDVLTADAPTLTFNRLTVTIPEGEFDWTNTGAAILRVNDKNLNLEFNNALFDLQVQSNEVGTYKKAFRFEQLGTTLFNSSTFKSVSPKTIDFNDPVFANVGAITLNDCTCENFTFIGRNGIDNIDCNGVDSTGIQSIVAGTNVTIDNTDPNNPVINSTASGGGGGTVTSVTVNGNDGIITTGGPITTSGTIDLNIDSSALRTNLNIEDGATADQTGSEIVNALNTELGSSDWQIGGGNFDGGTISNNLLLDNGTNAAPQIRMDILFGGKNYRNAFYLTNGSSNWSNANLTDAITRVVSLTSSYFGPSTGDVLNLARLNQRFQDGYFSGTLFASGLDLGGDNSEIVLNGGGTIPNNFQQSPTVSSYNINRILTNNETWVVSSSANANFTINDEATQGWVEGKEFVIMNEGTVNNTITLIEGGNTDIRGNLTIAEGETVVLRYIGDDVWMLK